jgi:hypothetical protein
MISNIINQNGTSKIKARGLHLRHLSIEERISLAADSCSGRLNLCNLSVLQSAALFEVPPGSVAAELKVRKAVAASGNGTIADVTSSGTTFTATELVAAWNLTSPADRAAALRTIGVGTVVNTYQNRHIDS